MFSTNNNDIYIDHQSHHLQLVLAVKTPHFFSLVTKGSPELMMSEQVN